MSVRIQTLTRNPKGAVASAVTIVPMDGETPKAYAERVKAMHANGEEVSVSGYVEKGKDPQPTISGVEKVLKFLGIEANVAKRERDNGDLRIFPVRELDLSGFE